MMKWGRRKKQGGPSSSSSSSSISRAFPLSWLSKFKQNCGGFEPRKAKREVGKKGDSEMGSLPIPRGYCREGRFYSRDEDDDDAFWRISFGEDRVGGSEKGGDCRNSVLRDSSEDEMEPELPGLSMNRSRVEARNFSKAVLSVRKMKGLSEKIEPSEFYKNREGEREEEEEAAAAAPKERNPGAAVENLVELQEQTDETQVERTKLEGGDKVEFELKRRRTFSSLKRGSTLRTVEESNLAAEEEMSSDWQNLKNMKIKEIKSRSEKREKSLPQRRRTKQSSRVGVYSPRTAAASRTESCKIKALEDMKRAKLKMKKKAKEGAVQKQRSELESFAIVKCSFDPQVDFRDSMVEMITEKRITRPRELEELLACYLTLNSDEYHDLIIKVFRQVWFDLNQQDGHLFP